VLVTTVFLVVIVWGNLTGIGVGRFPLLYDYIALPRLVVAVVGALLAWVALAVGWLRSQGSTDTGERPALAVDVAWVSLAGLGAWAVISALLSPHGPTVWLGQSERLEGTLTIVLYGVLYGLALQVGRDPRVLWRAARAFVAGSALLAAYGLMQMAGVDRADHSLAQYGFSLRAAFASTGNPNFLGGVMAFSLPVALALVFAERTRAAQAGAACAALAIAGALAGSGSQGAWFAFAVSAAVAAGIVATSAGSGDEAVVRRRRRGVLIALGAVSVSLLAIVAVSAAVTGLGPSPAQSGRDRVLLMRVAYDAAIASPLVGDGPDTYLASFRLHRPASYVDAIGLWSTNNNAHSWIPQFAATLGSPGALLLAAALILGLWRSRPAGSFDTSDPERLLRTGVWLGVLAYVAHLQFNVAMLFGTVPLWVLLGLLGAPRAAVKPVPRSAALTTVVLFVLLVTVSLAGSARVLQADATYMRARLAHNGLAQGDAAALSFEASRLNPTSVKYLRGAAQSQALGFRRALAGGTESLEEARSRFDAARATYRVVLRRWPRDYAARAWLTALEVQAGLAFDDNVLLAEALETARGASEADPLHWELTPLMTGDLGQTAIETALSVPGLP
jgi:hypothetical protein